MPSSPLVPSISGNQLNMSALLASPTKLNNLIAQLTSDMLVVDAFFTPAGGKVQGGQLLFDVLTTGGNFSVRDVEERAPGSHYVMTSGDRIMDQAKPHDWGAAVDILDEEIDRYDRVVVANRLRQLSNTLVKKVDQLAIAAVDAALTKYSIAPVSGHDWGAIVLEGATPTAPASRATADIANAALLVRVDDLGIKPPDTLVVHPQQLSELQIGYGAQLNDALAAVGITSVRSSMQVTNGTGYVVSSGSAGVLAFERPLTTETIPVREERKTKVQSYCVPAFGITVPGAIRKITGLAG
jgi:hypothetical protein